MNRDFGIVSVVIALVVGFWAGLLLHASFGDGHAFPKSPPPIEITYPMPCQCRHHEATDGPGAAPRTGPPPNNSGPKQ